MSLAYDFHSIPKNQTSAAALPSNAHTYRLLIFKELHFLFPSLIKRFVYQQHRDGIMWQFDKCVNNFLRSIKTFTTTCHHFLFSRFREEPNYSKLLPYLASV
jgi:hypothetical protein